MSTPDLALTLINKWHDTVLEPGGVGRTVTKIRYSLGRYGPFEATFDRDPDVADMERTIRDKRTELERLSRA